MYIVPKNHKISRKITKNLPIMQKICIFFVKNMVFSFFYCTFAAENVENVKRIDLMLWQLPLLLQLLLS